MIESYNSNKIRQAIQKASCRVLVPLTEEEIQEKIAKGYIKDSAGQWYDPTNYIDCYYADL